MSMPQQFYVAVISDRHPHGGEIAAATTSLLKCFEDERGIQPYLVAAATFGTCRLALSNALASRRIILSEPIKPGFLNPKAVDLWIALDDSGENTARRMIDRSGPAPDGFYRHAFPDPVEQFGTVVSDPPSDKEIELWLDSLATLVEPWRNRLWDAFCYSS